MLCIGVVGLASLFVADFHTVLRLAKPLSKVAYLLLRPTEDCKMEQEPFYNQKYRGAPTPRYAKCVISTLLLFSFKDIFSLINTNDFSHLKQSHISHPMLVKFSQACGNLTSHLRKICTFANFFNYVSR